MTRSTACLFNNQVISIDQALQLRREAKDQKKRIPSFVCIECGQLVDPHSEGIGSPAHFEHKKRNHMCSLSHPATNSQTKQLPPHPACISTDELQLRTAGGDNYIRTKDGIVKGLAIDPQRNPNAPGVIIVGKGKTIEARAKLFVKSGVATPTYMKRNINAWEHVGNYRATQYKTDPETIKNHCGVRDPERVAGILFLENIDEPHVDVRGAGFADYQTRKEIEQAAVSFVTDHYQSQHYHIESRESQNLGYDLFATKPGSCLLLEVKGTDSDAPRFFLTRNERKCAQKEINWRLVIVTNARTKPRLDILTIQDVESKFSLDPLVWECTPTP